MAAEPAAELLCPQCGAPVPVARAAVPYVVCGNCQTLILRDGEDIKAIGQSAVLPFDVSPIRVGVTGEADGQHFTVIGRVRWGWSDGSWNEWLLDMGSGTAWLAEAMGLYMVLAEAPEVLETPVGRAFAGGVNVTLGATVDVAGARFTATDIKAAQCLAGEGNLPFACKPDWTQTSIDFRSDSGGALSLQKDADGASAWLGRYVSLDELKPTGLRKIAGWTLPANLAGAA